MDTNIMDSPTESLKNLYEQFLDKFGSEVKPREGNNIRQVCPSCNHKSLSCNIQTGLVYCFHCAYGKGIKFNGAASGYVESSVDPELHISVSNKILSLCSLEPMHKTYLSSRGIYHPEKYGIVTSPPRLDKLLLQFYSQEQLIASGYFFGLDASYGMSKALDFRRILIPFWQGDKVITLKSRLRPYADPLSEEKRYICPKGSSIKDKVWYKFPLKRDVIITEGELAAIAAEELNFTGLGVPGISQLSSEVFLQEVNKLLSQSEHRVFIILDSDPGIQTDKNKLSLALGLNMAVKDSCVLYLPQKHPNEKMDLDQFISSNPSSELLYLMEKSWKLRKNLKLGLRERIKNL